MSLLPAHIYAYTSLRTGKKKSDLKANFEKTKLMSSMRNLMVYVPDKEAQPDYHLVENNMTFDPEQVLQVDIMTSARDGMHYKLEQIIEQAKSNPFLTCNTVIVITSLTVFGNVKSIQKYYKIFRKENIGVLYPDSTRESGLSEFSTTGFDFKQRPKSDYDRAFDLISRLEDGDLSDTRGRIGSDYTHAFRTAFWLYELFKVPEKVAVAMSGYSKNGFHLKADNYEQTYNYKKELETFEKNFSISHFVKRNRPVPDNFDNLIHWYEKKGNLELACIHCKLPMIFPIDYERLLLKSNGGKKELARCLKLYDNDLLSEYEKWIEAGNPPTTFYENCNMEQYLCSTYEIN